MGRALALAVLILALAQAQSPDIEFFEKKIRPVLAERCYDCHSSKAKAPMGGLTLDTRAGLLKGGTSGPAVKPGKPDDSLLVSAVRYTPPK